MAKVDPKYLLDGLIKRGARPVEAAAMVGNAAQESGFRTDVIGDGGEAMGLWQWNGPRKAKLINFAKSRGRDPTDPDIQMDLVWHELNTSESKALKAMRKSDNPRQSSFLFSKYYERPNPKYANNAHRMSAAESFFKMINPIGTAQADETPWQEPQTQSIDPNEFSAWEKEQQPQQQPQQAAPSIDPNEFAVWEKEQQPEKRPGQKVTDVVENIGGAVLERAGAVGNTLLDVGDKYNQFVSDTGNKIFGVKDVNVLASGYEDDKKDVAGLISGKEPMTARQKRQAGLKGALVEQGYDPNAPESQAAGLATDIAATAGAGGILAGGAKAIPVLAKYAPALETWGAKGANLGQKIGAGAATGAASSALLDPETAGAGAVVGGLLPPGIQAAGKAAKVVGNAALKSSDALKSLGGKVADTVLPSGKGISQEVKDLAKKAQEYGIDIPIDKIANSKVLNAGAKSLEYIPFSGREATQERLHKQVNRAVSKLIGEDTDNVVKAVGDAGVKLGAKFDDTLKNNVVKVDDALLESLGKIEEKATKEFGGTIPKNIKAQLDEVLNRAENGVIDGNAAYNLKRDLDRLGKGGTPEAFHFRQIKDSLMEALNRTLGGEKSAEFAELRKQYGNLKTLEKLVQNGAEGDISIARLAGLKGKKSKELKELADIASQFVKEREGQHGAAQRVAASAMLGATTGGTGLAVGMAGGRAANALLNSKAIRNRMIGNVAKKAPKARDFSKLKKAGTSAASLALRSAPVLAQQQTRQQ
jgi:hypothetical protein